MSFEFHLKNFALVLGIIGVLAVILDWYPYTMFIPLPYCMIWVYYGWLKSEPQLKWINVIFCMLYSYGIVKFYTT